MPERPGYDDSASALAAALWPERYIGDLTADEWDRVYELIDATYSIIVDATTKRITGALRAGRGGDLGFRRVADFIEQEVT